MRTLLALVFSISMISGCMINGCAHTQPRRETTAPVLTPPAELVTPPAELMIPPAPPNQPETTVATPPAGERPERGSAGGATDGRPPSRRKKRVWIPERIPGRTDTGRLAW